MISLFASNLDATSRQGLPYFVSSGTICIVCHFKSLPIQWVQKHLSGKSVKMVYKHSKI